MWHWMIVDMYSTSAGKCHSVPRTLLPQVGHVIDWLMTSRVDNTSEITMTEHQLRHWNV